MSSTLHPFHHSSHHLFILKLKTETPNHSSTPKTERLAKYNSKVPVSVRRGMFSEAMAAPTGAEKEVAMDPDHLCPLHNKPHPLRNVTRKCHTFCSKPIDLSQGEEYLLQVLWFNQTQGKGLTCEQDSRVSFTS